MPSLRMTLNNYQQTPITRQGLINLAIQLEANQYPRGKAPEEHAKPKQHEDRKKKKFHGQWLPKQPEDGKLTPPKPWRAKGFYRTTLSPAERERRRKLNLCFNCSKPEHVATNCPNSMQFKSPAIAEPKQVGSKPALSAHIMVESSKETKTCLSFDIEICLLDGSWCQVKALVNSGSELNFITQLLVKEAGWVEPEEVVQAVCMLDGRTIPVYGIHNVLS